MLTVSPSCRAKRRLAAPAQTTTASAWCRSSPPSVPVQRVARAVGRDRGDVGVLHEAHAQSLAGLGQPARELVDVAGGVGRRVEAGVAGRLQRRLDVASLLGRDRVAFQAAFAQQLVAASRGLEAGGVVVDVMPRRPGRSRCLRPRPCRTGAGASIASRVVAMVLRRWLGIWRMNCSSQEYLCQLKRGLSSSGALLRPASADP